MFPALLSHALRRLLTALAARLFFRSGGLVLPFGRRVAMPAGTPFMASGARTSQSGRRIPHGAGGRTQSVTRAGVAASGRCRKCPCGFSLPFRRKRSAVWPFLSQRQDFLSAVSQILPAGLPGWAAGSCRRVGACGCPAWVRQLPAGPCGGVRCLRLSAVRASRHRWSGPRRS